MNNMTKIYKLLFMAFVAVCLAGCDNIPSEDDLKIDDIFKAELDDEDVKNTDAMRVVGVEFSPGYKNFKLSTSMTRSLGPYAFTDTNDVVIKVSEKVGGIISDKGSEPKLLSITNTEGEEVLKRGIKVLVLVDLSLSQQLVDKERDAVKLMRSVFDSHNLFVSFMYGMNVSETMEVTDYVLTNYFVSQTEEYKYLFRAIWLKQHEMKDGVGVWGNAKKKAMVIFSDEVVYSELDEPFDPEHFDMEERLVHADSLENKNVSISAVRFAPASNVISDQASDVLKVLCNSHDGIYQEQFKWLDIEKSIMGVSDSIIVANEFSFENPDGKVYRGAPRHMKIEIYTKDTDSLIGVAQTSIYLGSTFNPVIVNGNSLLLTFISGLVLGLLILLLVYLVFQFIVPFIQYRLFKKKYVVKYLKGANMSVGNILVSETCYYCKAPFVDGDEVVVKCHHPMHKSCWDENHYHCPEYGRHCSTGSHYYNHENLFDPKNASFYLKWVLIGIVAAICSWFCYLLYVTALHDTDLGLVATMKESLLGENGSSAVFGSRFEDEYMMAPFGLFTGFFLTLGLSVLSVRRQQLRYILVSILLRSLFVGAASYLVFDIFSYLTLAFKLDIYAYFLYWIPWTIMAMMIAFFSTIGTRIHLKKKLILVTAVLTFIIMNLWAFLFTGFVELDIRVLLLFSFIFFDVCLVLAVAQLSPKSEHYFLNVKGAVKEMDIALFKWFLNNTDKVITIGKSIDCTLQMSWDLKGKVAPVQAEIRQEGTGVRLTAVEEGIIVRGKPMPIGNSMWLYHNTSFIIGDTTFTYVEKDI